MTSNQVKILRGHSERVGSVGYRSKESREGSDAVDLVTGATDGTIHLWSTLADSADGETG